MVCIAPCSHEGGGERWKHGYSMVAAMETWCTAPCSHDEGTAWWLQRKHGLHCTGHDEGRGGMGVYDYSVLASMEA